LWAGGGFALGIIVTLLALILLAPAPAQKISAPSGSTGIVVTIDNASLSHVIADGLAQANVPFHTSNIQARIHPGNMVDITGDATLPVLGTRRLEATGQLTVLDGHLSMHITRGSIGSLDLPAPVISAIESALDNEFVQLGGMLILGGNRYVVRGVDTTEGLLTLTLGNH
jgi:hypothetical protein